MIKYITTYNNIQIMTEILYQDRQVIIYKELMVINRYYFPLATSKTILFSQVERLGLHSTQGVEHRWGICGKYLNNWFPLDGDRKNKKKFIEVILKGKKTRPSITPDDPDQAFKILWEILTPQGKEYKQRESLKDGAQTQLAKEEMNNAEQTQQVIAVDNSRPAPQVESLE